MAKRTYKGREVADEYYTVFKFGERQQQRTRRAGNRKRYLVWLVICLIAGCCSIPVIVVLIGVLQ